MAEILVLPRVSEVVGERRVARWRVEGVDRQERWMARWRKVGEADGMVEESRRG